MRARRDAADAAHEAGEERQHEGPVEDHEPRPARQRVLLHDRHRDHRRVEGKQRAGVVGDEQRAPVGGHVAHPLGLDPPPDLVEELEQREDGLGELLVEAPLVLVVLALQAPRDRLDRVRSRAGSEPAACWAAASGSRPDSTPPRTPRRNSAIASGGLRVPQRAAALIGLAPVSRSASAPGCRLGTSRRRGVGAGEVADRRRPRRSAARSRAPRAAAGCRRRGRSAAAAPRRRPARRRRAAPPKRRITGSKSGAGHRHRRAAQQPQRPAERDRPVGGDVDRPADRVRDGGGDRRGRVLGVEQLQPRVEAELDRDDRQGQVADQRARRGPAPISGW